VQLVSRSLGSRTSQLGMRLQALGSIATARHLIYETSSSLGRAGKARPNLAK